MSDLKSPHRLATLALHAGQAPDPTTDVFEQRIAALEGGSGALAVASGQAATTLAILAITQVGDEIVSANNLYGGTYQLFHYTMPKLGRTVKFVDSRNVAAFRQAITPKTRAEQEATGVSEDYIRLSIGIEDILDIEADLEQALQASQV